MKGFTFTTLSLTLNPLYQCDYPSLLQAIASVVPVIFLSATGACMWSVSCSAGL